MQSPQFDLNRALGGAPVVTRNGRPMRFIAQVPELPQPLVMLDITDLSIETYDLDGRYYQVNTTSVMDLTTPNIKD